MSIMPRSHTTPLPREAGMSSVEIDAEKLESGARTRRALAATQDPTYQGRAGRFNLLGRKRDKMHTAGNLRMARDQARANKYLTLRSREYRWARNAAAGGAVAGAAGGAAVGGKMGGPKGALIGAGLGAAGGAGAGYGGSKLISPSPSKKLTRQAGKIMGQATPKPIKPTQNLAPYRAPGLPATTRALRALGGRARGIGATIRGIGESIRRIGKPKPKRLAAPKPQARPRPKPKAQQQRQRRTGTAGRKARRTQAGAADRKPLTPEMRRNQTDLVASVNGLRARGQIPDDPRMGKFIDDIMRARNQGQYNSVIDKYNTHLAMVGADIKLVKSSNVIPFPIAKRSNTSLYQAEQAATAAQRAGVKSRLARAGRGIAHLTLGTETFGNQPKITGKWKPLKYAWRGLGYTAIPDLAHQVTSHFDDKEKAKIRAYEDELLSHGSHTPGVGMALASAFKRIPPGERRRLALHYSRTGEHHRDAHRYIDGLIDPPKPRYTRPNFAGAL